LIAPTPSLLLRRYPGIVDGALAMAMLTAFRYHQGEVCKVTGKW